MKMQLDIELNNLEVDVDAFKECKMAIEDAKRAVIEIEAMAKDPEIFLYQHFEKLKMEVDLRREIVIAKVHEYSDSLIQTIEKSSADCMRLPKQVIQFTEEIKKSSKELDELVKEFDTLKINERKLDLLKASANDLKTKVDKIQVEFEGSLLGYKEYVFTNRDEDVELIIGKFFGSLTISRDFKKMLKSFTNISCQNCGVKFCSKTDVFSVSKQGFMNAFQNAAGFVHETITIYKIINFRLSRDPPTTQHTWFPGYGWQMLSCRNCTCHIGWKFTAISDKLTPQKFYGLTRKSVSLTYSGEAEEESNETDTPRSEA